MLTAELALADKDWPAARVALGDLAEAQPTARALAIMAAAAKGEDEAEQVVRGFLAKAVTAPRGPAWVCGHCGAQHGEWSPTCHACDAFDTLDWRDTPAPGSDATANAAMAPLMSAPDMTEPAAEEDEETPKA